MAAFARIGPVSRVILKGGAAMEMRLGLRARATKDLDAMVLEGAADASGIQQLVRSALAVTLCDGLASFDVRSVAPIAHTGAMRFGVRVLWAGRTLSSIPLEVGSAEPGVVGAWDEVPAHMASQFGIVETPATVPCLAIPVQIWHRNCTRSPTRSRRTTVSGTSSI